MCDYCGTASYDRWFLNCLLKVNLFYDFDDSGNTSFTNITYYDFFYHETPLYENRYDEIVYNAGEDYPGQKIPPIEVDLMFQIVSINECKCIIFGPRKLTVIIKLVNYTTTERFPYYEGTPNVDSIFGGNTANFQSKLVSVKIGRTKVVQLKSKLYTNARKLKLYFSELGR